MGDREHNHLRQVLDLLSEEVRRRVQSHPSGHLLAGRALSVPIRFDLPLAPRNGEIDRAAAAAAEQLALEVDTLLAQRAAFRPGRVFCLRCGTANCEHATAGSSREVFAGYGPSGLPRFLELGPWLLERADPRIDRLYGEPPGFLVTSVPGEQLVANLLPAYRDRDTGYQLHGQVVAGWYRGLDAQGHSAVVAITFQIASIRLGGERSRRARRRYGLNLVAVGPGEPLESFCNRLDEIPWIGPVRWAQNVLDSLTTAKQVAPSQLERRLTGLLEGFAARLGKDRRSEERRTRHARERHEQGDRPTRMAMADLARSSPDRILVDSRRDTLVVLGERGRAHVFSRAGKLVTSIRYGTESIERRRKAGIWREAKDEEILQLRAAVDSPA